MSNETTPKAGPSRKRLPPHLQTLLTLHHAFNITLSLHIAQHPPVLPPHSSRATRVQVPNLTNLVAIRDAVERSSGRRFGQQELARLAWLWTWDGEALPADDKEQDNPFLVSSSKPSEPLTQVSGLSYLITTTRTLCPKTGRRVHTHGLGIDLEIHAGETHQLLMGGVGGGLGNMGQGGGMRVIGRWNAGGDLRHDAVRHRLERWVELHGGMPEPVVHLDTELSLLPTPATHDTTRSEIPPIPLLPLPVLPSATAPAASLFAAVSTPLPPKKVLGAGLADPFEIPDTPKPAATKGTGTVEERRRALYERIKARSDSKKAATTTLHDAISGNSTIIRRSAAEQQEELKRRSTLSRLEGIAEGVWMMFSAPSPGTHSLPTAPRPRRKAIPLSEIAEMLVKSSKTPVSYAEVKTSLHMLIELCPFFLQSKIVAKIEWLEMPVTALPAPPSPGQGADRVAAIEAQLASTMASPPRVRPGMALAGPASPGRVRRHAGLREVRERIRRELGE